MSEELQVVAGLNLEFDVEVFQNTEPATRLPLAEYHILVWTRRGDNRKVTQWSSETSPLKIIVEPGAEDGFVQVRLSSVDTADMRSGEMRLLAQRKDDAASISPIAEDITMVVDS